MRNVARCWAYETSVLLNHDMGEEIPYNDFFEYYAPDYKLHLTPTNAENHNRPEQLQHITNRILQNLKCLQSVPSVQMHPVPPDSMTREAMYRTVDQVEDEQPDQRSAELTSEGALRKRHDAEFYDDETRGD